jgi:hypothetical protein
MFRGVRSIWEIPAKIEEDQMTLKNKPLLLGFGITSVLILGAVLSLVISSMVSAHGDDVGQKVLHLCVNQSSGNVFVVGPEGACSNNQTAFHLPTITELGDLDVTGGDLNITNGDLNVSGNIDAGGPTLKIGNSIVVNGVTDTITASTGKISFADENLVTTGKIGINADPPLADLHVVGNTRIDGDLICTIPCVGTVDLSDGAVTLPKIAGNSVDSSRIVDGAINTADLADGAATLAKMATDSVNSNKIVDGTITNADLGLNALSVNGPITGFGIVPLGSIIAWHKSEPFTPALPNGWVEANGQVLVDLASPYHGRTLPDLNGAARFLRGGAISGTFEDDQVQGHGHTFTGGSVTTSTAAAHGHNFSASGVTSSSSNPVDLIFNQTGHIASFPIGVIDHRPGSSSHNHSFSVNGVTSGGGAHDHTATASGTVSAPLSDGVNGTPRIGSETRPTNMSVVWIMRVK